MCGRYALRTPPKSLAKAFGVEEVPEFEARFNIAPTQTIAGVLQTPDGREMKFLKWGLVPSWAKDASLGAKLINARSETVTEKPSFHEAFKRRRCLIPADGFYEWARAGARNSLTSSDCGTSSRSASRGCGIAGKGVKGPSSNPALS